MDALVTSERADAMGRTPGYATGVVSGQDIPATKFSTMEVRFMNRIETEEKYRQQAKEIGERQAERYPV
jgi:hypothetical protein